MWVENVNALLLYAGHPEEVHWYICSYPAFAGNMTVIWPKDKETQDGGRS